MTVRSRIVLAILWALSLVVVAQWNTLAQVRPSSVPGLEVRFVQIRGAGGVVTGGLIANVDGQWLPVKLITMPDGNQPR